MPQVHKCFAWDCALKGSAHGEHMPSNPDAVDWTILGTGYIEQAFRLARKADATAKLFLNEYGIHGTNDKANYTRMLLQHLRGKEGAMEYLKALQANNVGPSSSTGKLQPKVSNGELLVANGDTAIADRLRRHLGHVDQARGKEERKFSDRRIEWKRAV